MNSQNELNDNWPFHRLQPIERKLRLQVGSVRRKSLVIKPSYIIFPNASFQLKTSIFLLQIPLMIED